MVSSVASDTGGLDHRSLTVTRSFGASLQGVQCQIVKTVVVVVRVKRRLTQLADDEQRRVVVKFPPEVVDRRQLDKHIKCRGDGQVLRVAGFILEVVELDGMRRPHVQPKNCFCNQSVNQ